ncbi:unnamed protein product [Calypogeia fissa]
MAWPRGTFHFISQTRLIEVAWAESSGNGHNKYGEATIPPRKISSDKYGEATIPPCKIRAQRHRTVHLNVCEALRSGLPLIAIQ